MHAIRLMTLILLLICAAGCAAPILSTPVSTPLPAEPPTPSPVPPTLTALPSPTAAVDRQLSTDEIVNATLITPMANRAIQLAGGKFERGSGPDYLSVNLLEQLIAFGDLNGDGLEDAAVLLAENGGGSGVFVSLMVIYNQDGKPAQGPSSPIDDRPRAESLSIEAGQVRFEGVIHGPGDVMINPTLNVVELFMPEADRLRLARFNSKTPDGRLREIEISSPAAQSEVSQSVQVSGRMPIAPFENNLAYRIFDRVGNKLAEGPFPVSAQEPGGPAEFDQPIDLQGIPAGPVWLELVEVSMADGSTMALQAVKLVIK